MTLAPGTRLGPYEILASLGAGGMGEVYRARDTRLDREVAIKVLPEDVAKSPDRRARFEREAKAVAALSHAGILALHDVSLEGDPAFVVTELLEGETLRERLAGGPLPVRKAVDYGVQAARALAAAHARGIVHRDLKPENLFLVRDGQLKILDFGLARQDARSALASDTRSPTLAQPTDAGTVLGTVGYMSPEQVRGETVDSRSDIFSLGAVLYEMLSGRRAFQRGTAAETMTAILREDPPALERDRVSTGASFVPAGLERVVSRCLEKSPEERFQSARDLAFALEAASASSTSASGTHAAVAEPAGRRPRAWARPALYVLAGAILGALALRALQRPVAYEPPRVRPLTFSGHDSEPAVSPDGRLVAFSSDRGDRPRIWIKQLQGGGEAPLTEGPDSSPRFSPDGSNLLFLRTEGGRLDVYRTGLVGGAPRKVMEDVNEADWAQDGGSIAFVRAKAEQGRGYLLGVHGLDSPSERTLYEASGQSLSFPRFSPDGKTIAVVQGSLIGYARYTVVLVDAASGTTREATPPGFPLACAAWSGDGRSLVVARAGSVLGDLTGVPGRVLLLDVASGAERSLLWANGLFPLSGTGRNLGACDVVASGEIVYEAVDARFNLSEVPIGPLPGAGPPRSLTVGASRDRQPAFSPDGERIVFSSNRSANLDLWVLEPATGALRQLTDDPAQDWDPGFTPDGQHVLWSSDRSGHLEIWRADADGANPRPVTQDGVDAENPTATPDGKWIVYASGNPEKLGTWKVHPDGTGATRLVPGQTVVPEVSPDGRLALFAANPTPTHRTIRVVEIDSGKLVPFEISVDWTPSSSAQILWGRARWTPDGRAIVFVGADDQGRSGVYLQDFVPGRDTAASRRRLAGFRPDSWVESLGVSPDGKSLAISTLQQSSALFLADGLPGVELPHRRSAR
jgi:Tol biopolymer transport system component